MNKDDKSRYKPLVRKNIAQKLHDVNLTQKSAKKAPKKGIKKKK